MNLLHSDSVNKYSRTVSDMLIFMIKLSHEVDKGLLTITDDLKLMLRGLELKLLEGLPLTCSDVFNVLILLLGCSVKYNETPFSNLVYFWVIFSSRNLNGTYMKASRITQKIAHLMYFFRLSVGFRVILSKYFFMIGLLRDENILGLLGNKHLEGSDILSKSTSFHLSLLNTLLKHKSSTEAVMPTIFPDLKDTSKVTCKGFRVSFEEIKGLVKGLSLDIRHYLNEVLSGFLVDQDMFTQLTDDLDNTEPGYSFMVSSSKIVDPVFGSFMKHLNIKEKALDKSWVLSWFAKCSRLLNKLFTVTHLVSGLPARGTELESYIIENTTHVPRTVYWVNEQILFIVKYNKINSISGKENAIVRALPSCLSKTFALYVLLIRRVQR